MKTIIITILFIAFASCDDHVPLNTKDKFAQKIKALNRLLISLSGLFKQIEGKGRELEDIFITYEKKLYPNDIARENIPFYRRRTNDAQFDIFEHLRFTENELVERLNDVAVNIQQIFTNCKDGKYRMDALRDQISSRVKGLQGEPYKSIAAAAGELDIHETLVSYYKVRSDRYQSLSDKYLETREKVEHAAILLSQATNLIEDYDYALEDLAGFWDWEENFANIKLIINNFYDPSAKLFSKGKRAEDMLLTPMTRKSYDD